MPSISDGSVPMTWRLSAVISSWTGAKLPYRNGWFGHSDTPFSAATQVHSAPSLSTHRPPVRTTDLRKSRRFIVAPPFRHGLTLGSCLQHTPSSRTWEVVIE